MEQTPLAKNFWDNISGDIQVKLLNNVWCSSCRNTTSIAVAKMSVKHGDLILEGSCTTCNSNVARLIEGEIDIAINKNTRSKTQYAEDAINPDIFKIISFRKNTKNYNFIGNVEDLNIESCGNWEPDGEIFNERDEDDNLLPLHHPYDKIKAIGRRPAWEMENILPGYNLDDFDCPIGEGIDIYHSGDWYGAVKHMKNLLKKDDRCLDAYAHLGNWYLEDGDLAKALNFYKTGAAIGIKSIDSRINDVFPWGLIDNRPFFRCLHGLGITLYRKRNVVEALSIFIKMIWLNPSDNQGARFLINDITQISE